MLYIAHSSVLPFFHLVVLFFILVYIDCGCYNIMVCSIPALYWVCVIVVCTYSMMLTVSFWSIIIFFICFVSVFSGPCSHMVWSVVNCCCLGLFHNFIKEFSISTDRLVFCVVCNICIYVSHYYYFVVFFMGVNVCG